MKSKEPKKTINNQLLQMQDIQLRYTRSQKSHTSCWAGTSGPFKAFAIKSLTAAPRLVSANIP